MNIRGQTLNCLENSATDRINPAAGTACRLLACWFGPLSRDRLEVAHQTSMTTLGYRPDSLVVPAPATDTVRQNWSPTHSRGARTPPAPMKKTEPKSPLHQASCRQLRQLSRCDGRQCRNGRPWWWVHSLSLLARRAPAGALSPSSPARDAGSARTVREVTYPDSEQASHTGTTGALDEEVAVARATHAPARGRILQSHRSKRK